MNEPTRLRRLALVGAVAALALLGVGALLLRVGDPPDVDDPQEQATEADTPRSGEVGDAGPTAERAGAPAGFSHNEAGAIAAAVSYAGASQRWLYWTDEQIATAVAAMATPEATERITGEILNRVRAARDELVTSPGRVWWLVHPLAWRVEQHHSGQATVAVWTMTLLSAADVAVPQTEWVTFSVDLDWVDGDWRVASLRETAGPTPMIGPGDEPWQPEPFDEALTGFTRLDGEPVQAAEGS